MLSSTPDVGVILSVVYALCQLTALLLATIAVLELLGPEPASGLLGLPRVVAAVLVCGLNFIGGFIEICIVFSAFLYYSMGSTTRTRKKCLRSRTAFSFIDLNGLIVIYVYVFLL